MLINTDIVTLRQKNAYNTEAVREQIMHLTLVINLLKFHNKIDKHVIYGTYGGKEASFLIVF